jgi:uncharacterized membrane protein
VVRSKGKVLAAVFVVAAAALTFSMSGEHCTMVKGTDVLNINLERLAPGSGETFCYTDAAGAKIRFVLARGKDGKVRSVFDACRRCYSFHKGYTISGGELICRVCGNRYPIERMTVGKASCVPAALPIREAKGAASIKVADLVAGRGFF